jgi:hypothetical protein
MWRSFFLAAGVFLVLLGAQCLGVQKFVLKTRAPAAKTEGSWISSNEPRVGAQKEVTPREWAPWSLMSTGVVVCLYSFTLPRRMGK